MYNKTIILFNHEDISNIIFTGYSDEEEKKHKVALKYIIQQDLTNGKEDTIKNLINGDNSNAINDSSTPTINLESLFD